MNEEILIHYNKLSSIHQDQKEILNLIKTSENEKVKELNDIIQSYNYSKLCAYYENTVNEKIENSLREIRSCSDVGKFLANQREKKDIA